MKKSAKKRARRSVCINRKKRRVKQKPHKVKSNNNPTEIVVRIKRKFNNKIVRCRARKVEWPNGTVKFFLSLIKGDYSHPLYPPFDITHPKFKSKAPTRDAETIWRQLCIRGRTYHKIPLNVKEHNKKIRRYLENREII